MAQLPLEKKSIDYLTSRYAQSGKVEWIGLRPERKAALTPVHEAEAIAEIGLAGDHYASKGGKRQVTLIQYEHIKAVASMMGIGDIDPGLLRRNVVVSGINLAALKGKQFWLGEALLEYTGECHPCSRMEENLGDGGYNAMRGHGGINCRVIKSGLFSLGDALILPEG